MKTRQFVPLIALALASVAAPLYAQTNVVSSATFTGASGFSDAKINNQGTILYSATVASKAGYYTNQSGTNTLVVQSGDNSAAAGSTYSTLDTLDYKIDSSGRVTFRSSLSTTATNAGLFRTTGTTTSVLAQKAVTVVDPSPSTLFSIGNYDANNNGMTAFAGRINSATNTASDWGLWTQSATGTFTRLLTQNDTAPGLSATARFSSFAFPSIDDSGNVSFFAAITNDLNAGTGVFTRYANGTVAKIAAGGDIAPGLTNANFTFFSRVVRNNSDVTAFWGGATGSDGTQLRGIWSGGSSSLSLVAISGQTFVSNLGTLTFTNTFTLGNLNANSTGVFKATTTGASTQAVFSFNGSNLTEILAQGDSIFGSTVATVGTPSINDNGIIAFSYTLTNGVSGIYSSAAVVVPEANTVALFGIGISALGIVIKRRGKKG